MLNLEEILERLNTEDESVEIEAKNGSDVGKSMLETISAFSNEPDQNGGYLVLGVVRDEGTLKYKVTGVEKMDDVKTKIATVCRNNFNLPVSPSIKVETIDNKSAIIVYIPEAQSQDKPIFIKSRGVKNGSFRRITSTDHHCTDEDLLLFVQLKSRRSFDETPLPETSFEDFEPRALQEYKRLRAEINPAAEELTYSDKVLLDALGATTMHQNKCCATVAGVLLFGKATALKKHFGMMRVDYLRVSGNEWMNDVENRYESSLEMREALVLMIPRLINQIMEDIPKRFSLPENSPRRQDIPLIPFRVIRESVANALMHRDYNLHSTVQVVRYSNRLEIINPGYSLIPEDNLGEPGASRMRNPKIASVLHDLNYAETKGTGIRTMRTMMKEANLTVPIINSDRNLNIFGLTLLNIHFVEQEDVEWLENFRECNLAHEEAQALLFVRKTGFIHNAAFRAINRGVDTLKASRYLQRLRDLDLLEQRPQGSATYYIPGVRFLNTLEETELPQRSLFTNGNSTNSQQHQQSDLPDKSSNLPDNDTNLPDKSINLPDKSNDLPDEMLSPELLALYPEIDKQLKQIGKRTTAQEIRNLILKLCVWQDLRSAKIAEIVGRTPRHLTESYLTLMIQQGLLEYVHPNYPAHPKQAYRTTDKGKQELR